MPIAGKLGAFYCSTNAASASFTDEATTKASPWTRYKITNQAKRFWDDTAALTVKKNGATITTGFTVEWAGGELVFNPPLISTDTVTVSGKYFAMEQQAGIFEWKLDGNADLKDVTTFASLGWKEQVALLKSITISAQGYWANNNFFGRLGTKLAVSLFVDTTSNKRYEGYMFIKKNGIEQPVDDVVKEQIDMEGTGIFYYHE